MIGIVLKVQNTWRGEGGTFTGFETLVFKPNKLKEVEVHILRI